MALALSLRRRERRGRRHGQAHTMVGVRWSAMPRRPDGLAGEVVEGRSPVRAAGPVAVGHSEPREEEVAVRRIVSIASLPATELRLP